MPKNGKKQLTAADVLALAGSIPREEVEIGDGYVWVRGMTGRERSELEIRTTSLKDGDTSAMRGLREWMVTRCLVDDKGQRLFADKDEEAIAQLAAPDIDKLFEVAWRLSGMGKMEVEKMGKASAPGPSAVSVSGSPSH